MSGDQKFDSKKVLLAGVVSLSSMFLRKTIAFVTHHRYYTNLTGFTGVHVSFPEFPCYASVVSFKLFFYHKLIEKKKKKKKKKNFKCQKKKKKKNCNEILSKPCALRSVSFFAIGEFAFGTIKPDNLNRIQQIHR